MIKVHTKTIKFFIKMCCFVGMFLLLSGVFVKANAATLIFSPQSGTYSKGSSITVNVYVSSTDKVMNAAAGVISFPTDLLSVTSISKAGSIIGFWAQEPTFSNTSGTITFEGVVLPPWYSGSSGKILTITFKTKTAGFANLSFISSSVLAADGIGTEIITGTGNASFNISDSKSEPVILPSVPDTGTPSAPEVLSSTHPDSNKWYSLSDALFSWGITKDITGSSLLIGKNPNSSPTVLYDPPISSREVKDLDDGVWYFHVQLRNGDGWGGITHFKLQVDTERPSSFDITEIKRDDITNPVAKFRFSAVDKTSGIDHYEIQIDGEPIIIWEDTDSGIYKTPPVKGGNHTLLVRAVDKAGNFLINSVQFYVEALESPIITEYPSEIQSGDILTIRGTTKYTNAEAKLWLEHENGSVKSYLSKVEKNGNFTSVVSERLKDGLYKSWVEIIDERGATSLPSDTINIVVRQSTIIRIGSWAVSFLAVLIPLLALIFLLGFLLWYAWYKFFIIGKKLKKEVKEAEDALHKAFDLLKESIAEQVKTLEKTKNKRELTEEEEKINKQLKRDLEDAEKYIKKEIQDIDDIVNK